MCVCMCRVLQGLSAALVYGLLHVTVLPSSHVAFASRHRSSGRACGCLSMR